MTSYQFDQSQSYFQRYQGDFPVQFHGMQVTVLSLPNLSAQQAVAFYSQIAVLI